MAAPQRLSGPAALPALFRAVQAARLYPDSKTLADMPLAAPPDEVAAAFAALQLPEALEQRRDALARFCARWLLPAGSDVLPAVAPQLGAGPPPGWLPLVQDPEVRQWAAELYRTWGALVRQAAPGAAAHPNRHSLLVPPGTSGTPFVMPSANRFREQYYWDTLFSLQGLLVCGLVDLARSVLETMLSAVEAYGHVPNGLRSYYLNRSQPPLLSQMVAAVHAAAPDPALLRRALAALQREHAYWSSGAKQVLLLGADGRQHRLSRYCAAWDQPRPESYREDVATAEGLGEAAARQLWRDLASAAESGWDFSSRWLADGRSLASCRTTAVVPADLNAMLYQAECTIAAFADELGETDVAAAFRQHAAARRAAIDALLWEEGSSQWWDLVLGAEVVLEQPGSDPAAAGTAAGSGSGVALAGLPPLQASSQADAAGAAPAMCSSYWHSDVVAASNWVPLYCGCAPAGSPQAAAAVAALRRSGLLQSAGVAVTLSETGQQWDWPNAWPPITAMLIEGCASAGGQEGQQLAAQLAQQYLETAHAAWRQSGRMHEKFDALHAGAPGGGGEYACEDGFGWTNGVALRLLQRYGWRPGAAAAAGGGSASV